jgi:hypothetical protein
VRAALEASTLDSATGFPAFHAILTCAVMRGAPGLGSVHFRLFEDEKAPFLAGKFRIHSLRFG